MTRFPQIKISHVSKIFSTGGREVIALEDISLDIKPASLSVC